MVALINPWFMSHNGSCVFIQPPKMVAEQMPPEATPSAAPVEGSSKRSPDPARPITPVDAWLARILGAGPVKVIEIQAAAKSAGMSMRTVERAKKRLGVKAAKLDMRAGWVWSLPDEDRHEPIQQAEQATTPTLQLSASPPVGPALWQVAMVRNDHSSAQPLLAVPLWAVMGRK